MKIQINKQKPGKNQEKEQNNKYIVKKLFFLK